MKLPMYALFDLSAGTIADYPIDEDLFRQYLGGKSLAARLLYDLSPPGADPLGPEAVVIINTGPMNNTGAPSSSRFNMTFKNVLTGGIGFSNCGGTFGFMLKRAGYDGLIFKGQSHTPLCIEITDGEITVRDAASLWGLDAEQTQQRLPQAYGKLVIGPAGENLVRYACAVSGERVAGRGGAGAVLGAKRIKAVIAFGTKKAEVHNKEKFDKYVAKWTKFLKGHPMTGESLPAYGSGGLVNKANASHALPTRNFQKGYFASADEFSGETLAYTKLTRNSGCISCPIRCERRVRVGGREVKGPEYETLGLFGANIENSSLALINEINYTADILGLDTISLAGTLAFAMELNERGLADFGVSFGRTDNLIDVIYRIARREGMYAELGEGSKRLSEKYGGAAFAIHAKGMELAAYEPRRSVGMGLGYAVSNRGGCHLGGGYMALLESVGVIAMDAQTPKGKPEWTVLMQNAMDAASSAGFCLFTLQTFVPAFLYKTGPSSKINAIAGKLLVGLRWFIGKLSAISPGGLFFNSKYLFPHSEAIKHATGLRMTTGRFLEIGERGFNLERLYNLREGLSAEDDALPERLTRTRQDAYSPDTVVDMETMLPVYYKVRGWDRKGVPTHKKRRKLGLL